MCGIVGYIGKREALPILMDGLKRLEYRGYDSAGFSVANGDRIVTEKAVGKVAELENKINEKDIPGNLGIAHTRWATHGKPSERNAHPHRDCSKKIFLVHNGIIENYKELKHDLEKAGHKFSSETDTEVLAHLIEEYSKQVPFEEAVWRTLAHVRGTYGLAIIDRENPQKLIIARNGSPLVLGVMDDGYVIASDVAPIVRYTDRVIYLDDGEMAEVTGQSCKITNFKRKKVKKEISKIDWSVEEAEKKGYPHFMLKEIMEQPEAVENSIRGRLVVGEGIAKLGGLRDVSERLRRLKRLVIVSCGTSYYAGLVGKYMLEEYAGVRTDVEHASEFRYRKPLLDENTAVLAISQSGETADTLAAIREAKNKGAITLGIVNVVGSTIARETDAGVYNHAGPEIGVASTKAFTSQLSILALLTLFLGRQREMSFVMGKRIAEELAEIPKLMKSVLNQADEIKKVAEKYSKYSNFLYLGRKYNYPIAMEGALKIKEISYVHAEGYPFGEMKHGPIALIDKNFPTMAIATKDSVYEKTLSGIQEVKARSGKVIAIATKGDREIQKMVDDVIYIPKTLEMLTPLLSVVPLQLFAYHFAVGKGLDVDKPRNLAKSVTVE
ncbi:MAG: glutamine--fructose-6-phosphate transaminase (isomerizing) [Candidatus Moranbacteria bacterium CG06_land_8_20_14_3_00_43_56]|nr:MAG: glutamine--fructose-6-phosphate transaminase (isomerizing) [Candidatus Moranbacteria bacterium CG06_land_8_20_14_3_00_43_56]PIV83478.1 MAG: glutamine--fructose-6-phosphate transaminase (isomerizing) [Candidatus Moranbacteria bacterium CG17_big_fil_post_rev_8_21_14_2_50_44_12]PIW92891.1 MAG: glutamine--fructose-6-phosphate transaminase (isomerizing) [Candidatus Moranbacteria bacterium CG_4_8_14_3_um_filter_43_15]PJA85665.1 MAG: glutamine--fructose-6-phosphate transaminase (isomerizing) [C